MKLITLLLLTIGLAAAQAASPQVVDVTFTPTVSAQAIGYNVYRATSTAPTVRTKLTPTPLTPRTVMLFTDTPTASNVLTDNVTYIYVLRSVDAGGSESIDSASASVLYFQNPLLPPTGTRATLRQPAP